MDAYEHVRNIPFQALVAAFGGSMEGFRTRKNGSEWFGPCLIHKPKKNSTSFSYHLDGRYACFSCKAHGRGPIDLTKEVMQLGFRDAVAFLERVRAANPTETTPRPQTEETPLISENPTFAGQYEKYAVKSAWLEARGFTAETLKRFTVFEYNNAKRRSAYTGDVLMRIDRFSDGACVGYLARNIGEVTAERPKYRFPKGFHKGLELFGAVQLKDVAPIRRLFLVESPFAAMKFAQLGVPAVSPFGWHVSPQQVAILRVLAKGVVYLPDSNKRGESLAVAGELARWMWTRTPDLPEGVVDPENLTHDQIRALA